MIYGNPTNLNFTHINIIYFYILFCKSLVLLKPLTFKPRHDVHRNDRNHKAILILYITWVNDLIHYEV
jgi:hypothetical protein